MNRTLRNVLPIALLALLTLAAAGCAPGSPEEKIAKIRAGYTIELNSWQVMEPAVEEPAEAAEEAAEEAGATAEEAVAAAAEGQAAKTA